MLLNVMELSLVIVSVCVHMLTLPCVLQLFYMLIYCGIDAIVLSVSGIAVTYVTG